MAADSRKATAGKPELAQKVANFKKWHAHHVELLKQAAVSALDLGNKPTNADTHALLIEFTEKPGAESLPVEQRFVPVNGFTLTLDDAKELLTKRAGGRPGGAQLLEASRATHEFMKKKGGLGIITLLLLAHGMCDITTVVLPTQQSAKLMQETNPWGDHWVECMELVLQ